MDLGADISVGLFIIDNGVAWVGVGAKQRKRFRTEDIRVTEGREIVGFQEAGGWADAQFTVEAGARALFEGAHHAGGRRLEHVVGNVISRWLLN